MSQLSIVVVDDEPCIQTYLSDLLGGAGYVVDGVADGDQLFERLRIDPLPSLILLDVLLPGRDGIQVIQKMNEANLSIPVIVLSGFGQTKTVVEAMKLGAADFLQEPVDEEKLIETIKQVMEASPRSREWRGPDETADSKTFVTANA